MKNTLPEKLEKILELYHQLPEKIQNSIKSHQQIQGEYNFQEWNVYLLLLMQINGYKKDILKVQLKKPQEPRKPVNPISEGIATAIIIVIVLAFLSWFAKFSFVQSLPLALIAGIITFFVKNKEYYKEKSIYAEHLKNYNDEAQKYEKISILKEKLLFIPNLDFVEQFVMPLLYTLKDDIEEDSKLNLFLNFQKHKLSTQKTGIKDNYKHPRLISLQTDFWTYNLFELKARFYKKIKISIRLTDTYRQRDITKRGASGKIKRSSKHKMLKKTLIQTVMNQETFEALKAGKSSPNIPKYLKMKSKNEGEKKTILLTHTDIASSNSLIDTDYMPDYKIVLQDLAFLMTAQ
ncbi:MAG: hypothetical protein MUC49_13730 [Raineya sp.]|jgi:hypothetical protein|nr:hypothetical protein [Raineya sp.]